MSGLITSPPVISKFLSKTVRDLYLNLESDQFIDFLAREERSYTPQLFNSAIETMTNVMQKHHLITPEKLTKWRSLAEKVKIRT